MKEQIEMIRTVLDQIDNDPRQSMSFFTGSCYTVSGTRPKANCREILLTEILHKVTHQLYQSDDCQKVDSYMDPVMVKLNDIYQRCQHHCWLSHAHHFHPNFIAYVNCPITCLAEISDYLLKIQKEMYTT